MATIEIVRWREDAVGFTGWDAHAKSELKRRLRFAINASSAERRSIAHQVEGRHMLVIRSVQDAKLASLRQILETLGADVVAEPSA